MERRNNKIPSFFQMNPTERACLIQTAVSSTKSGYFKGSGSVCSTLAPALASSNKSHQYGWKILPTTNQIDEIDPRRAVATESLGSVIFDEYEGAMARMTMLCYDELWNKTKSYGPGNVVVMVGGGNATTMQMRERGGSNVDRKLFSYSDLDIKIMIRPSMPNFSAVKDSIKMVVNQVVATHKRRLDRCFFKKREGDRENDIIFNDETTTEFKRLMVSRMASLSAAAEVDAAWHCPFEDDASRNKCSKNSYFITKSKAIDGNVKVQIPHLVKAENIPLGYSPVFVSVNESIDGTKPRLSKKSISDMSMSSQSSQSSPSVSSAASVADESSRITSFDLYRIRINNIVDVPWSKAERVNVRLLVSDSESEDVKLVLLPPYEKVVADVIDISIQNRDDTELIDFERRGGFRGLLTETVCKFNQLMIVPTMRECAMEYYKMLNVFECPECKREKRERKYACLIDAIDRIERIERIEMNQRVQAQMQIQRQQQQQYYQQNCAFGGDKYKNNYKKLQVQKQIP